MFKGTILLGGDGYLYVPIPMKLMAAAFMMTGELGMVPPKSLPNYGRLILATPAELAKIASLVNERGKSFSYSLDTTTESVGTGNYSKLLGFSFKSSDFDKLRTSYGIEVTYPSRYFVPFAGRPISVFRNDAISKIRDIHATTG